MCVCFWGMEMRQYSSIRSKNVGDIFRLFSHIRLFLSNPAYLQSNQVMGWGEKAIELRSANTGNLEGVFMHKKAQKLKFLCERNDKVGGTYDKKQPHSLYLCTVCLISDPKSTVLLQVFFASVQSGGSSQIYFMTLGQNSLFNW